MAVSTLTPVALCNQALRNLGESPITAFTDATVKAQTCHEFYATVRDALLEDHAWNFAMVRTVVRAYSEPAGTLTPGATTGTGVTFTTSITGVFPIDAVGMRLVGDGGPGDATIAALVTSSPAATLTPGAGALVPGTTGVTFTASAAVFVSGDVGKLIDNLAGPGLARITSFTSTTVVVATIIEAFDTLAVVASGNWRLVRTDQVTADITEDFADTTPIAAGDWRLYNATPSWGFTYRLTIPDDCLRILRTRDSVIYQREGIYLVSDEESLAMLYISRVTDVRLWPLAFAETFVARLTAMLAEPITGQLAKREAWLRTYQLRLARAKINDGQEGSSPQLRASDLALARFGRRRLDNTRVEGG